MTKIYSARWVLPVVSEPFEGGAVAVEGTRVAGVGARAQLAERFPSAEMVDLGEAAILPGFVNCHTHLELTAMRGFLEPEEGDFFAWLRKITVARRERMTPEDLYASAAWGAAEAARAGGRSRCCVAARPRSSPSGSRPTRHTRSARRSWRCSHASRAKRACA